MRPPMLFTLRSKPLGHFRQELLLPIIVFFVFFLSFFWKVFLLGELPLIGDPVTYSYPLRTVVWQMIRSGTLPLWIPYIFSGYPLLSMAQLGIGYPLTWGYLILPGHWAETVCVLAPFLLAPIFLYVYLREVGRSRFASIVAALGFAYGGMMSSKLSNGFLPNSVMWLPLLLVAIERSRSRRFVPCLIAATLFYGLAVLTGIGQGIVLTGLLAGSYACFVSIVDLLADKKVPLSRRLHSFKPVALIVCAGLLAFGLSAFQIFETWSAVRLSIREQLSYGTFAQMSLPFWIWWRALLVPLYFGHESVPYLAPMILLLAAAGSFVALRRPRGNYYVVFWVAVAVLGLILMLGGTLPTYKLVYKIPILNRFRAPSRHSYEWTLAVSVLSAYGWDALSTLHCRLRPARRVRLFKLAAGVLLISAGVIAGVWVAFTVPSDTIETLTRFNRSIVVYGTWKITFVLTSLAALYLAWRLPPSRQRAVLLGATAALACFIEAYIFMAFAWASPPVPAAWFKKVQPSTQFLLENLEPHERAYFRVTGFSTNDLDAKVDVLNLPARYRIQNIGGYEPLITRDYSRMLYDVWLDGVRAIVNDPLRNLDRAPAIKIFDPRSKVLDVLGASLIVLYSNFRIMNPLEPIDKGISFAREDFVEAKTWTLGALAADCDSLAIVSTLSNSGFVETGALVAKIRVFTRDGRVIERELLAGRDTAEWAYERPDVRRTVRHSLPTIFASSVAVDETTFLAHRYLAVVPFGERVAVDRVEITPVVSGGNVTIFKATLFDSSRSGGTPMTMLDPGDDLSRVLAWLRDGARWEVVYDKDGVLILKNRRAMPRAWLVGSAEIVQREEALARVRGESQRDFDPRTTVLLENPSFDTSILPGSDPRGEASIIRYETNRISIETRSEKPSVLVVGEVDHPGWKATLDDRPVTIDEANFILRAVGVPAGTHRIEMFYTAPGARRGAVVSAFTLLLIMGLVVASRRWHRGRT